MTLPGLEHVFRVFSVMIGTGLLDVIGRGVITVPSLSVVRLICGGGTEIRQLNCGIEKVKEVN